jgi:hypothetical protein
VYEVVTEAPDEDSLNDVEWVKSNGTVVAVSDWDSGEYPFEDVTEVEEVSRD